MPMLIRLGAVVLFILAAPAVAQEFCVTCSAPDAKYRCLIGGEPNIGTTAARGQLLCITELARTGGHASCSVGRATDPCEGELRTVMYPIAPADEAWPVTEISPEGDQGQPPAAGPGPQEPQPAEAPQTVEQLAKDTVKSTGNGLEKAGEAVTDTAQSAGQAIGNAAQKTWNCLSSLFSDC